MTWADLLTRWRMVANDLHAEYGIDVWNDALMTARPWMWLREKILGLLDRPASFDLTGHPVFTTRIQAACYTPPPTTKQDRREG